MKASQTTLAYSEAQLGRIDANRLGNLVGHFEKSMTIAQVLDLLGPLVDAEHHKRPTIDDANKIVLYSLTATISESDPGLIYEKCMELWPLYEDVIDKSSVAEYESQIYELVGLTSEWEDNPESREVIELEIVRSAEGLAAAIASRIQDWLQAT
jgi:hypothetical protein